MDLETRQQFQEGSNGAEAILKEQLNESGS